MGSHRGSFRLNKAEKKFAGVCAGIADHFDVDVTLVRVATALFILMTMPAGLIAYLAIAIIADRGDRRVRHARAERAPRLRTASMAATRERMRDLDARMQAIETSITSSNNNALAREIDALR